MLQLLFNLDSAHLLIVGTYRDNEVSAHHPLLQLIADAKASGPDRVTQVRLNSLHKQHVRAMLQDSFRCDDADARLFARLLMTKTTGNPFHLQQLLHSFHKSGLLYFDFAKGKWIFELEKMRVAQVHSDVVGLLCDQMRSLSTQAQRVLQYSACSGSSVSLHTLAILTGMDTSALCAAAGEVSDTHTHTDTRSDADGRARAVDSGRSRLVCCAFCAAFPAGARWPNGLHLSRARSVPAGWRGRRRRRARR